MGNVLQNIACKKKKELIVIRIGTNENLFSGDNEISLECGGDVNRENRKQWRSMQNLTLRRVIGRIMQSSMQEPCL